MRKEQDKRPRFAMDIALALILFLVWAPIVALSGAESLRLALGAPLVLFVPGYLITSALFPRRGQVDGLERATLSLGLSIASITLLGLLLNYTPWGLRLEPMAVALGLLVAVAGGAALLSRHLSGQRRFRLTVPGAGHSWSLRTLATRGLIAALVLAAVGGGTWAFYVQRYAQLPQAQTGFTQFYILGADGLPQGYPQLLWPGQEAAVQIGIENNEGQNETYWVRVEVDGRLLARAGPIPLVRGGTWQQQVKFAPGAPGAPGARRKVEFLLYREGVTTPYRSLHLWLDVQTPWAGEAPVQAREVQ